MSYPNPRFSATLADMRYNQALSVCAGINAKKSCVKNWYLYYRRQLSFLLSSFWFLFGPIASRWFLVFVVLIYPRTDPWLHILTSSPGSKCHVPSLRLFSLLLSSFHVLVGHVYNICFLLFGAIIYAYKHECLHILTSPPCSQILCAIPSSRFVTVRCVLCCFTKSFSFFSSFSDVSITWCTHLAQPFPPHFIWILPCVEKSPFHVVVPNTVFLRRCRSISLCNRKFVRRFLFSSIQTSCPISQHNFEPLFSLCLLLSLWWYCSAGEICIFHCGSCCGMVQRAMLLSLFLHRYPHSLSYHVVVQRRSERILFSMLVCSPH